MIPSASTSLKTFFAPAERLSTDSVLEQAAALGAVADLLDYLPDIAMILNAQHIPHAIQLQLFQRSFSTKGPGRGVGTYSIRLLTERYLGGKVVLSSEQETGARFELVFPKE